MWLRESGASQALISELSTLINTICLDFIIFDKMEDLSAMRAYLIKKNSNIAELIDRMPDDTIAMLYNDEQANE